jgi:hypothetical protein
VQENVNVLSEFLRKLSVDHTPAVVVKGRRLDPAGTYFATVLESNQGNVRLAKGRQNIG